MDLARVSCYPFASKCFASCWVKTGSMNNGGCLPSNAVDRGMERDPSDAEDLRKVEDFLRGDVASFEFLFEKYREKIYAIAYRFVHNKEDALDVSQEVFLRVYQGLKTFKTNSKFFTWIYRIAVNRAIDFSRARRTRRAAPLDSIDEEKGSAAAEISDPQSPDPEDILLREELAGKLLKAVGDLSPKHRTVFILHAMENLSYKEIAEVAGCSIGTVMSRLFYARKRLKEALAEYGPVIQ